MKQYLVLWSLVHYDHIGSKDETEHGWVIRNTCKDAEQYFKEQTEKYAPDRRAVWFGVILKTTVVKST